MARPTGDQANQRDKVEEVLFDLSSTLDLQDEVELRIRQAKGRSPVVSDVLDPALERLDQAGKNVRKARGILAWLWHLGQKEGWDDQR